MLLVKKEKGASNMNDTLPLIYRKYGHHNWHGPIRFPLFLELYKHCPTPGGPVITQYRIRHEGLSRNTPL